MNAMTKLARQPSRRSTQWQRWLRRGCIAIILALVALVITDWDE